MEPLIIALLIGLIWGGSVRNVSRLRFRFVSLILIAFLIQIGIDFGAPRLPAGAYPYLHLISYLLLLFALFKNRGIPGIPLIIAGTVLNFLVISFNGGQMPVQAGGMSETAVGALATGVGGTHGLMQGSVKLSFLADVISLPVFYHPRLISLGDIILNLGMMVLIVKGMKTVCPEVDQKREVDQTP